MKNDALDAFNLWFAYKGGDLDSCDLAAAMAAFDIFYDDMDTAGTIAFMDTLGFESTDALLGLCDSDNFIDDDLGDDFDYDL